MSKRHENGPGATPLQPSREETSHLPAATCFCPSSPFPDLTHPAAFVRVYAETRRPPLAVPRERRYGARVAGKTNLQFSLSIHEALVNGEGGGL